MEAANSTETLFEVLPPKDSDRYTMLLEFCETNRSKVLASLPWVAGELVDGGPGFDGMFEYIRQNGGTSRFIDVEKGWFSKNLSFKTKERLMQACPGVINIPSASIVMSALRNVAIVNAIREKTISVSEIVRKYGVSKRYIFQLKSKFGLNTPEALA